MEKTVVLFRSDGELNDALQSGGLPCSLELSSKLRWRNTRVACYGHHKSPQIETEREKAEELAEKKEIRDDGGARRNGR